MDQATLSGDAPFWTGPSPLWPPLGLRIREARYVSQIALHWYPYKLVWLPLEVRTIFLGVRTIHVFLSYSGRPLSSERLIKERASFHNTTGDHIRSRYPNIVELPRHLKRRLRGLFAAGYRDYRASRPDDDLSDLNLVDEKGEYIKPCVVFKWVTFDEGKPGLVVQPNNSRRRVSEEP